MPETKDRLIAWGALGVAAVTGLVMFFKNKAALSDLVIKEYTNLRTQETLPGGQKLGVTVGDTIRVTFSFDYQGPETNLQYTGALFWGLYRMSENSEGDAIPDTPTRQTYEKTIDVPVNWGAATIETYADAGLYIKIDGPIELEKNIYKCIRVFPEGSVSGPEITSFRITDFPASIERGATMNVTVGFDYVGDAISDLALRVALGRMKLGAFDEYAANQVNVQVPVSSTLKSYTYTIPLLVNLAPENSPYTLEAKIAMALPKIDRKVDAVTVTGPPSTPQLQNVEIYNYPTQLVAGQACHIGVYFEYKGPARSVRVLGAIGYMLGGFHQSRTAELNVAMGPSENWQPALVDVAVPTNDLNGTFSLRATVDEQAELLENVLQIQAAPTYGQFYVRPVGETGFYHTEWMALWEVGNHTYVSKRAPAGMEAHVAEWNGDIPSNVLLTGRLTAYLINGYSGDYRVIGPSGEFTALNSAYYEFNLNTLDVWRV